MDDFFIYVLLDPRKKDNTNYVINETEFNFQYKPFYVGKGKGNRIQQHYMKCSLKKNTKKNNKILKIFECGLQPISIILFNNLKENNAYDIEKNVISIIGLSNLTNMVEGGVGQCSLSMRGDKNPMFGKHPIPWNKGLKGVTKNKYKGKKLEDILGDEKAADIKNRLSEKRMGKSWEEYFGKDKAREVRIKRTKERTGYKHKKETIIKMKNSSTPDVRLLRRNKSMVSKQKKFDFDMNNHKEQMKHYIKQGFDDNEIIKRITDISKYRLKKMLFLLRNNLNSNHFFKLIDTK